VRMSMKIFSTLLLLFCFSQICFAQTSSQPCDRACLEGFVEKYLDAAIAHDPKLLPLSPDVKFTENGQRLELPDAHWKIMTGKGKYRLFVADPEAHMVAPPYGMNSGWSSWKDGLSSRARDVTISSDDPSAKR
jgi:hypothetical protein